jgi:hypothetical protein
MEGKQKEYGNVLWRNDDIQGELKLIKKQQY